MEIKVTVDFLFLVDIMMLTLIKTSQIMLKPSLTACPENNFGKWSTMTLSYTQS